MLGGAAGATEEETAAWPNENPPGLVDGADEGVADDAANGNGFTTAFSAAFGAVWPKANGVAAPPKGLAAAVEVAEAEDLATEKMLLRPPLFGPWEAGP